MLFVFIGVLIIKNIECKLDIRCLIYCMWKRKNKKKVNRIIRIKIVVIYYLGCFFDFFLFRGR